MPMRMTGLTSGLDTESIVGALVMGTKTKKEKIEKKKTKLEWTQDAWKDLNKKVYSLYTSLDSMRRTQGYALQKTNVSDQSKAKVSASGAFNGTFKLQVNQLAQTASLAGGMMKASDEDSKILSTSKMSALGLTDDDFKLTKEGADGERYRYAELEVKVGGETKTLEIKQNASISDVVEQFRNAGLKANFDEKQQRFYINSKDSGKEAGFEILQTKVGGTDEEKEKRSKLLSAFGLKTMDADAYDAYTGDDKNSYARMSAGQDAKITLDGVKYTNKENSFSVNGLTIEAMDTTEEGKSVTITTSTDTQGLYDKVKDFLTNYNEVINELYSNYNADSVSKDYQPLTEDQKAEMSDKEIEKWETKAKSALLRRDTTLNNIINSMTQAMGGMYEVNGKKMSLTSFGIHTMGYYSSEKNQQYAYHIDGDEEDSLTSGNTDKLMKALQDNPDEVIGLLTKVTQQLYTNLDNKMKSTSMSSAYTIYNDKQMTKDINAYKKSIAEWEKKVTEQEDRYYKQYSRMESTLTEMQSKMSSFTSYMGG